MPADQCPEQTCLHEAILEIERLREENYRLRRELDSEWATQERKSALEVEFFVMDGLHKFIERGILAGSVAELGSLACESAIYSLGCEGGILLLRGSDDGHPLLFHSGLLEISADTLADIQVWAGQCCAVLLAAENPQAIPPLPPPLPQSLGLCGPILVQPVLDEWGRCQGLMIACNTLATGGNGFSRTARIVFRTLAKQLGPLMVALKRHLTIIEQIGAIRVSEERLSAALVFNNVGLWDWDLVTGRIEYSDQWKRQLGLESDMLSDAPDEWIGRIHPDDWDHAVAVVHNCCMALESSFELTVRIRKKDGSWIWINSRGHHAATDDGTIRRMIGTQIDVTSYKSLEAKLLKAEKKQRRAKELAERENRAKSSFLAAMSHEIRTPLNGILGVFQMLGMSRELDRAQLDHLVGMGGSSARWLLRIVGESLDIARIESGKLELKPEVVDLGKFLEELKSVKSKRATHLGLDLRWQVDPDVPRRVLVDALRLRQILTNLIVNAMKFTSKGFVNLEVRARASSRDGKQSVSFTVSDSGIGFSKEFGRTIFAPFTQGLESNALREHGVGMGLAITKELVGLMDGKITFSSRVGKGSTFTVTLPVMDMTQEISEEDLPEISAFPSFQGKILLVDDDQISAEIGQMMLGELGLQVDLAADGQQGLEMAGSVCYDLILMDCWMPVMGGIEATRRLRASTTALSRDVPIFALTANARESDAAECRAAGMDEVIIKPLILENLIEKLMLHLRFDPGHAPL